MSLYKNTAYSPVLDVIVIKEAGAIFGDFPGIAALQVPRPNHVIAEMQDSYCGGKIMLARNCINYNTFQYPVTVAATTATTIISTAPMTPILLNMRTTQATPPQITCSYETGSRYTPHFIQPPLSSLNYEIMKRTIEPHTTLNYLAQALNMELE